MSVAIGQGFNLVTPLQICLMTATIANGGKQLLPQIIEKITDPDGKILEQFEPVVVSELKGAERFLPLIRDGMEEVIQGRRGTARKVRIKELTIGHFLVGEAIFVGLESSITEMRRLMDKARSS